MALIVDTGPLYAAMDRSDAAHADCVALLQASEERIVIPAPVVVEVEWLASARLAPAAFDAFLETIEEGGAVVEALRSEDYSRIRELCRRYADLPLGFVDAAVIAVLERLDERKVATLDRKHFSVVRPAHVRALRLLPEPQAVFEIWTKRTNELAPDDPGGTVLDGAEVEVIGRAAVAHAPDVATLGEGRYRESPQALDFDGRPDDPVVVIA